MTGGRPEVVRAPSALRRRLDGLRAEGLRVGLVPTMGALHPGHLALIRRARRETDRVVVSIFVNPLQFDRPEDLRTYPRDPGGDRELLAAEAVDLCFAPSPRGMFPPGFATRVEVLRGTDRWEGEVRPGHLDGVATVVTRLLLVVGPCRAYFGEKDAQQLQLVRRVARDLALPVRVVACATVREADGLAWSSRNRRLDGPQRQAAACLPRAVAAVLAAHAAGEHRGAPLGRLAAGTIRAEPQAALDYAAVVDPEDFGPVARAGPRALLVVAARFGPTRLIDSARLGDLGLLARSRAWGTRPSRPPAPRAPRPGAGR